MTRRVLVYVPAYPVRPYVRARAWESINALAWDGGLDIVIGKRNHEPYNPDAALDELTDKYNNARRLALAGDYDALLTIEADMIVPSLALYRLMQQPAPVVYGLYCSRRRHHKWLAYTSLTDIGGVSIGENADEAKRAWGKALETKGVGMGCTLIRRDVLERVPFRREMGAYANDWYFALDCQYLGIRQVTDFGCACGHIDAGNNRIIWPDPDAPNLYRLEVM